MYMKKYLVLLASLFLLGFSVLGQKRERQVVARLNDYFVTLETGYTTVKDRCKVEKVKIDTKRRKLTIYVNELFTGQTFNRDKVDKIYKDVKRTLYSPYNKYKIEILGKNVPLESLINNVNEHENSNRRYSKKLFDSQVWARNDNRPFPITKGLDGSHLSVYASHGRYYKHDKLEWTWQRPYLYCTTEDLFTQSFVVPYLIPMLEKAGAYVFTPRERDWQANEIIIDNDTPSKDGTYHEYNQKNSWSEFNLGFAHNKKIYLDGENPFKDGTSRFISTVTKSNQVSEILWTPMFKESGRYGVYVSYVDMPSNVSDAQYVVCHKGVKTSFTVNQQMGGGTWTYLGTFDFDTDAPQDNYVSLSNLSKSEGTISADAVRFGGGMGNIARGDSLEEKISGFPRFLEGARYNAQWSGMPYDIYSRKQGSNDYADDINVRSLMTNYLAGGSTICPSDSGLRVPIELSMAIHSDAGIAHDSTFIGTLGIYTTDFNEGKLSSGLSRLVSRDMCDVVMTQVNEDLSRTYGKWKRRAMHDRNYSESREPNVPSMILEILSHQNFKDMMYGHDPNFKFTLSRAIYKGILKFLSFQHQSNYVVQPLPITNFSTSIDVKTNEIKLTWSPVIDTLEATATPEGYVVYVKEGDKDYDNGRYVKSHEFVMKAKPDVMYSFKVSAVNSGGESFCSEELAAMISSKSKAKVLIIDGFQRVAGPQVVYADSIKGFDMNLDPGVPFHRSPAFCGKQIVFNEASNSKDLWGVSGNELEGKMIAGNTFNYTLSHGKAISSAEIYSFSSVSRAAVEAHKVNLNEYDVVDLILGLQKDDGYSTKNYPTLSSELCSELSDFMRLHGNLLVSGAYLARDQKTTETVNFLLHYLKVKAYAPIALSAQTQATGMNTTLSLYSDFNDSHYAIHQADCLIPDDNAFPTLIYSHNSMSAAVAYPGKDFRTISLGFPFECIKYESDREKIMAAFLNFLLDR